MAHLNQHAAELQRRLVADAHAATGDAAAVLASAQALAADAAASATAVLAGGAGSPGADRVDPLASAGGSRQGSPSRAVRLSPHTWQLEPVAHGSYTTVSGELAAAFGTAPQWGSPAAPLPVVPRSTSD